MLDTQEFSKTDNFTQIARTYDTAAAQDDTREILHNH